MPTAADQRLRTSTQLPTLSASLSASLKAPHSNIPNRKVPSIKTHASMHRVPAQLPTRAAAYFVLQRLAAAQSLLKSMQSHCTQAAAPLSALLAQTYFMPFALTAVAIVARVRVLSALLVTDIVAVYNALVEVAPALPVHPINTVRDGHGTACLESVLKDVWGRVCVWEGVCLGVCVLGRVFDTHAHINAACCSIATITYGTHSWPASHVQVLVGAGHARGPASTICC